MSGGICKTYVVTGGAGFIGSHLVRRLVCSGHKVINVDKLTYAGSRENVGLEEGENYVFVHADIGDQEKMKAVFDEHLPDGVFHLAAESHVDRSIYEPSSFIRSNIEGTYVLLEVVREYLSSGGCGNADDFRFVHVSTDEVYGPAERDISHSEMSRYAPSSPYSASKAASDHLVSAWSVTYALPVILTNCTNNYGPGQHKEKLIPKVVDCCLRGEAIPVYGSGDQVRDWLYVEDHVDALLRVMEDGVIGETYCVSGGNELTNREVVGRIVDWFEKNRVRDGFAYASLVKHVEDRPGHDFRYSLDSGKLKGALGWEPGTEFGVGLERTIVGLVGGC